MRARAVAGERAGGSVTERTMTIERVAIDAVHPHPRNAREGDVGAISESIKANGVYKPIVVQRSTGAILAGNHTWKALKALGRPTVDVVYVDVDDERALRIMLADNRTSDQASYDDSALAALLEELRPTAEGLTGTGFDGDALDDLLQELGKPLRLNLDEAPPAPAVPKTRTGDLYEMGEHRLLCGDSTKASDATRLMAGAKAALLWTDPPYGVDYTGKTADALKIKNDGPAIGPLLDGAFAVARDALSESSPFYLATPAGSQGIEFRNAVVRAGWKFHETLVWVKDSMVLGHSDYHLRHEEILYGWLPGSGRPGRGDHAGTRWYGDHAQTSVFEVARPKRSEDHPTMKPPELIQRHLENSSKRGDAALDLFAGSGSTLIACEQTSRRAYLMEIDPAYCDVIVARWEKLTGKTAKKVAAGAA